MVKPRAINKPNSVYSLAISAIVLRIIYGKFSSRKRLNHAKFTDAIHITCVKSIQIVANDVVAVVVVAIAAGSWKEDWYFYLKS